MLYAVGSGEFSVSRSPGSPERLLLAFLSPTFIETTLGPCGLEGPFLSLLRGGEVLGPSTSAAMRRIAVDLLSAPYLGDLQRLFVLGKTMELLAACASDLRGEGAKGIPTMSFSRRQAHAARDILAVRLATPPSLPALAAELGTSVRALTEGFRQEFGQSIGEHVAEARLLLARERLEFTAQPIKQVAAEAGYAFVNNFSAAFARRFGEPPARFRSRSHGKT